jgi:cell division septation protein DedD
MTHQVKKESQYDQAEAEKKSKRFRFEFSFRELFFYGFGLFLAFFWMFVFGILIGRGTPLVNPEDLSVRGHLMRFLGLGRESAQPSSMTTPADWDTPKKMLESLNYYEDLTQRSSATPPALRPVPSVPMPAGKQPPGEASSLKKSPSGQPSQPAMETGSSSGPQASAHEPNPPERTSEHFSLLVSSMKEAENAQRLVDQLRSKGYTPRIESINLSGSGRWNRVLVGSFQSREDALRFMAEFNRKEHMEALVIGESQ